MGMRPIWGIRSLSFILPWFKQDAVIAYCWFSPERQEREPVSIVFHTLFRYTSSWYTSPYDWSILTVGVNSAFALAESGKHSAKPSYTTHFDTRNVFFFWKCAV